MEVIDFWLTIVDPTGLALSCDVCGENVLGLWNLLTSTADRTEEEQVSFFALSMMMKNRSGASRNSAPTKNKLTLHTDQQSLILAEMMCARNKLQEENQQLRDRLQDAEMLIQLLHLKLEETSGKQRSGTTASAPPSPTSPSNLPSAASMKMWRQKRKSQLPAFKQRDAFKNTFARAMRTFEPKSRVNSSVVVAVEKTMTVSRPELIQGSTARTVSPERNDPVDPPDQDSAVLTPDSVKLTCPTAAFRDNKLSPNDDAHQMRSVIGMLAQSVINDYSTPVINRNE